MAGGVPTGLSLPEFCPDVMPALNERRLRAGQHIPRHGLLDRLTLLLILSEDASRSPSHDFFEVACPASRRGPMDRLSAKRRNRHTCDSETTPDASTSYYIHGYARWNVIKFDHSLFESRPTSSWIALGYGNVLTNQTRDVKTKSAAKQVVHFYK
jgi:hypothetical protein